MRKIMIRNTILMLLVTVLFSGVLTLYLRSAASIAVGEPVGASYTASAEGFCSDVIVTAGYNGDTLASLTVDASGETPEIGGIAADDLVTAILAAGSADGIDSIAGATYTADAVLAAFADCEVQAGRLSEDDAAALLDGASSDATASATGDALASIEDLEVTAGDDMYSASAPGYASNVSVILTYTEGVITSISIDATGETESIGGAAAEELAEAIVTAGSSSDVDAVAGATVTSNAILAASRYIENEVMLSNCTVHSASVAGYSSDVTVTVYELDGVMMGLTVDASGETPKVGGTTADEILAILQAAGNADGVDIDAYAGSTITADAVLEAFALCIEQSGALTVPVVSEPVADETEEAAEEEVAEVEGTAYIASAKGYSSDISIVATYNDGVLVALTVDASGETPKVGGTTADAIVEAILAAGNADDVDIDAYAGSTITAEAVLEAFAECEEQA